MTALASIRRRAVLVGGTTLGFEAVATFSSPSRTTRAAVARERLIGIIEHADNSADQRAALLARLGHPVGVSDVWLAPTRDIVGRLTDGEALQLALVLGIEARLGRALDRVGLA